MIGVESATPVALRSRVRLCEPRAASAVLTLAPERLIGLDDLGALNPAIA